MPATCHNLDFSRTAACGCSFNSSFDRFSSKRKYVRKVIRSVSNGGRRLICCRSDGYIAKCRVFSTEAPETLVNGIATFI